MIFYNHSVTCKIFKQSVRVLGNVINHLLTNDCLLSMIAYFCNNNNNYNNNNNNMQGHFESWENRNNNNFSQLNTNIASFTMASFNSPNDFNSDNESDNGSINED